MLYDKDPILPFQVVDKIDAISERMPELDPVQECFVQLENTRELGIHQSYRKHKESSGSPN